MVREAFPEEVTLKCVPRGGSRGKALQAERTGGTKAPGKGAAYCALFQKVTGFGYTLVFLTVLCAIVTPPCTAEGTGRATLPDSPCQSASKQRSRTGRR